MRIVLNFIVSAALIFASWGCAKREDTSDVIRIGIASPFTGNAAAYGEMIKKGAFLKVDEVNASGGVDRKRVEAVFGDDAGDPKEASNVATKFAYDKSILIVIGHFNSSCSLAGKPIYKRGGVVQLSPGPTNVRVCEGSPWTFRNLYRDDFQG